MSLSQRYSNVKPSTIFLIFAILIGGFIRLAVVLQSPLPLGDGGMFYVMVQDLINNHFKLPEIITYNFLNLPNVYPPLAFYIAGFITRIFSLELIDVIRVLPAVFTVLAIPAFFIFVKNFIKDENQLIIALLIFSLIPPSFDWLIMGGGLTRAPGFFFSILALHFIYRLYTEQKNINILWASIFSALTFLSHPQIVLFTAVSAVVFFLFLERNRSGVRKSLLVAIFTLLLTAPWWGTILVRSGISPFFAAVRTGGYSFNAIIGFFKFDLTKEIGLTSIGVLGFFGIFWYLNKKSFFLPIWFLISFIIDPRSAPRNLAILFPIFASCAIFLLFSFFENPKNKPDVGQSTFLSGMLSKILLAILIGQWVFSSFSTALIIKESSSLTENDKTAMEWIIANTPSRSKFLVLTGLEPLSDPFSEWLPALTNRESLATTQGKEWDSTIDFDDALLKYWQTQNCMNEGIACFDELESEYKESFDYLYIREMSTSSRLELETYTSAMIDSLEKSGEYEPVYEGIDITIIKRR